MKIMLLMFPLVLVACGGTADTKTTKPNHILAAHITDPSAPTVADLERRGLIWVDDEATGWTGPAGETVDGFTAIYMGRDVRRPAETDRQFICPVDEGSMETWKCRAWAATNG